MKLKKTTYSLVSFISALLIVAACKPKFDVPDPGKGDIDPSRYVAVGSTETSGFADGALYFEGQQNSFAAILAEQLKAIGGTDFKTPYVSQSSSGISVVRGNTVTAGAKFVLGNSTDCKQVTSLAPIQLSPTDNFNVFSNNIYASSGPFNNMGVRGTKSFQVAYNGYGSFANAGTGYYNPYFERMASNKNTASVLSDALDQHPTFFTLSIGMHDVLGYALAGGAYDSITTQARFDAAIDNMVNKLTANGAKGAIGNIPDFTKFPYFTTIPYNGLTLDAVLTGSLNGLYNPLGFNNAFREGANGFVINDPAANLGIRQIKEGELLLLDLPLDSVKCLSMGSLKPIHNEYVLTLDEIQAIRNAIAGYNIKLQAVAQAKGLAYVDLNTFFNSINSGIVYNGVSVNAEFVKGGNFSLDGIQLNPIGNALMANEFIKAINKTYHSTILQVDATKYRGTIFP